MRALFYEYSKDLRDGTYIFVAKVAINEVTHDRFSKDFFKLLTKLKTTKES